MSNIIYLLIFFLETNSVLIFHFKKLDEYDGKTNYINFLKINNIGVNLEIGNPSQTVFSRLTFSNNYVYFKGSNLKGKYNEKESKSYKKINESKQFYSEPFKKGIYSIDSINLYDLKNNKISDENFSFILAEELSLNNKECYNGNIGLQIPTHFNFEKQNLINQFKLKNYINEFIWTIKYNSNFEGDLIIGNEPSFYDNNYFNLILKKTRVLNTGLKLEWGLSFDNIIWNKTIINSINKEIILDIDLGVIYGTEDFKEKISINFFQKYYSFGYCKLNIIDFEEEYFTCKKQKVDISKFPSLLFIHKDFNYTFELDYNDLFIEYDNIYYFLIIFNRFNYNSWKLGRPFFKKYQLIFNQDLKYIGFYNGEIIPFKPSIPKIIIFTLFILILLLCSLLIFIYRKKKNKKQYAKELNEDFETDFSSNSSSYNSINN